MIEDTTIATRLAELRSDHEQGERALRELDARREQLQVTLLRVGGAIQVLEELLAGDNVEQGAVAKHAVG